MKLRRNVGIGYNLASCFVAGMLGFEWGACERTVSYLRCARKIWRGGWCSGLNHPAVDTTLDFTVLAAHQRKPQAGKRPGAKITELSPDTVPTRPLSGSVRSLETRSPVRPSIRTRA